MTKSELILNLCSQFPTFTQVDIKKCIDTILDSIGDELANGGRTEVRGFGSFGRRIRNPTMGRNPKTGADVHIPIRAVPYFKPIKRVFDLPKEIEEFTKKLTA